MIFAREASDPLTSLVKKIDAATVKNSADRMCSFVVFLTDEENAKDKLKTLADKEGINKTILTIDNVPIIQAARLEDYSPELWALTGSKGATVMSMLRYVIGDDKFE